mmetsp:Transcript_1140/g.3333  ORF Transcript_1140/g.3333 Transcript_1140/m.3333 type:complete len:344 (-) Transcript_1140:4-1035(-)
MKQSRAIAAPITRGRAPAARPRLLVAALALHHARALSSTIPRAAKRLTEAHVEKYSRDGVLVVRNVVDAAAVDELRAVVEGCVASPGPFAEDLAPGVVAPGGDRKWNYFTDLELSTRHPALRAFATDGAAAAVAARLMDSETATFFYDQLFVKPRENEIARAASTVWHQDLSYWAIDGDQICSVAIALDDHASDEGLYFVPGSHRGDERAPVHFATGKPYQAAVGLAPPTAPAAATSFDVSAGDAIVFDARLLHGGPGSFGRSLVLRFAGDDVRFSRSRFESGRCAIPTADPGLADGAALSESSDDFPLCFRDPLFGKRGSTPVSVVEWSKGVAVSEERGDFS